jgi:hypothetical protein
VLDCRIDLGDHSELVVGKSGVLADCTIRGNGRIVVHGRFFEGSAPGIVGPSELVVSQSGVLVAAVEHGLESTRFAFERGSRLRMKVVKSTHGRNA